jgi:hypothetical protein
MKKALAAALTAGLLGGCSAGTAPSTSPPSPPAAPSPQATFVDSAPARAAVKALGQQRFDQAIGFSDAFVAVAHGDCTRLSGQGSGTAAVRELFTPRTADSAAVNTDAFFLNAQKVKLAFPAQGCADPSVITWRVLVAGAGTEASPLKVEGDARTTLHATDGSAMVVGQTFFLSLVTAGSRFGWLADAVTTSRTLTNYL